MDIDKIRTEIRDIKAIHAFLSQLKDYINSGDIELVIQTPIPEGFQLPQNQSQNPMAALMGLFGAGGRPPAMLTMKKEDMDYLGELLREHLFRLAKDKEFRVKAAITGEKDKPSELQVDLEESLQQILYQERIKEAFFKAVTPIGPIVGRYGTNGRESRLAIMECAQEDLKRTMDGTAMPSFWESLGKFKGVDIDKFLDSLDEEDMMDDIAYIMQQKGVKVGTQDIMSLDVIEENADDHSHQDQRR